MVCETCEKQKTVVYEDDKVVAYLHEKPAADGHIAVMPKEHCPIMEACPDELLEHVFNVANKISALTFEAFQVQGTNIIVHNGLPAGQKEPHFQVHVIPRRENDGLSLQWQPKQAKEEDLQRVEGLFKEQPAQAAPQVEEAPAPKDGPEDYLLETIDRIP